MPKGQKILTPSETWTYEESPQMGRPQIDSDFVFYLIVFISFIVHISTFIDYIQILIIFIILLY